MSATVTGPENCSEPQRFRKRPVVVEAMHLSDSPSAASDIYLWVEGNTRGSFDPLSEEVPTSGVSIDPETGFMLIATLEGVMTVMPGDWVVRGVQGEFYPVKDSIFCETYEPEMGTAS